MAKRKKTVKKIGGPFLAAAIFCENILEDSSGLMSVQRIMDGCQVVVSPFAPPDMPSKANPVPVAQNILLIFRTGDAPGKHELKLVMQGPNGKRSLVSTMEISLTEPSHGGVNVKTVAKMMVYSSGVFLIDVILDGKRFTRMPLNIDIQRLPSTQLAHGKDEPKKMTVKSS
jgi:hypothetical protein